MTELSTRAMEPTARDLARFRDCFAANEEVPRDPALFEWQYLRAPGKRTYVDFAVDEHAETPSGSRIAAIYAVFPVPFLVGGQRRLGTQSLDTLTDAAYRGRGLFVNLARSVYERCAAEGVGLVYGFPNGNSVHGFTKKLGWTLLDPVPFLIRPLRTGYALRKVPGVGGFLGALADVPLPRPRAPQAGRAISRPTRFGHSADDLWGAFAERVGVGVWRGSEYLNWRLGDKPLESYRTLAVERGGRLDGFVTMCLKEKHGGRIGYIMELLHAPDQVEVGADLLTAAVRELADEGADAVLAWNLPHSPNAAAFQAAGFLTLPERLRPIELHFGVRALDPALETTVRDRAGWYLSYCDSDTV